MGTLMEKAWDAPARADDKLTAEALGAQSSTIMVVGEKAARHLHELPETWLRARVRGWMELNESPGLAYWIGTYTPEGKWIWASSNENFYLPKPFRQHYAMQVAKFLNLQCNFGGAWLAGWFRGGREFYLLWKDQDGDISVVVESDKAFSVLARWGLAAWERHACTAWAAAKEMRQQADVRPKDTVKLAQGARVSAEHIRNAPK